MPRSRVTEAALPAEKLKAPFPKIELPIRPPYPPMEAKLVEEIPPAKDEMQIPRPHKSRARDDSRKNLTGSEEQWQYEPKWDGFRCLAFRKGDQVVLQSKAGQPLGRYFPELVAAVGALPQKQFVLDGEIVIERDGLLSFDDLLMRIHPAESRIRKRRKHRQRCCASICWWTSADDRSSSSRLQSGERRWKASSKTDREEGRRGGTRNQKNLRVLTSFL